MLRQHGFTLLELLVVLSLIGLVAGVAAPRLIDLGDRLTFRNQLLEVRQKVNGLPLLALRGGSSLHIDDDGAPLELPVGWRVKASPAVTYRHNGSCLGGRIEVWRNGIRQQEIQLAPPFCQWSP